MRVLVFSVFAVDELHIVCVEFVILEFAGFACGCCYIIKIICGCDHFSVFIRNFDAHVVDLKIIDADKVFSLVHNIVVDV